MYFKCLGPDIVLSPSPVAFRSRLTVILFLFIFGLLSRDRGRDRCRLYLGYFRCLLLGGFFCLLIGLFFGLFLPFDLLLLALLVFLFFLAILVVFQEVAATAVDDDFLCFFLVCEEISVSPEETKHRVKEQVDIAFLLQ